MKGVPIPTQAINLQNLFIFNRTINFYRNDELIKKILRIYRTSDFRLQYPSAQNSFNFQIYTTCITRTTHNQPLSTETLHLHYDVYHMSNVTDYKFSIFNFHLPLWRTYQHRIDFLLHRVCAKLLITTPLRMH